MNTCARIVTISQAHRFHRTVEENRSYVLSLLRQAIPLRPDLVCLPEAFATVSVPGSAYENAESAPGPTTDAVAAIARDASCWVICPLLTLRGGEVFNSAVVIARDGSIHGIYDKHRPVTSSGDYTVLESGVRPGGGQRVFDLDFGRVGIAICFDVGFPEDWREMEEAGARLVVWPSAYDGGNKLAVYAAYHGYYVTTSVRSERSRIIGPGGELLAASDRLNQVAWADINLDFAMCHYDFNFSVPDWIRADYGERVKVTSYPDDGAFLVAPADSSVTVTELMERYGFEDSRTYHARHRRAYRSSDESPRVAQTALHGDRPPYAKVPAARRTAPAR